MSSARERSNQAGSPPVSGLLQPVICGDESLSVVEVGHRPLATESESSEDILQDGDSSQYFCQYELEIGWSL